MKRKLETQISGVGTTIEKAEGDLPIHFVASNILGKKKVVFTDWNGQEIDVDKQYWPEVLNSFK